jgi:hypothetical protein
MQPWMIEEMEKEKRRKQSERVPLYLPLDQPRLTGSSGQDKIEKEGTATIDYLI